ncbi:hypothetical protein [Ammoniphilus sp. CFH 90114]|uniref:hypothetical protein n=1 Tax=Ammoniphilus sp. CFH 90114 TaxID=2493665 RepID=UPI0013E9380D|nr:hypothetical protein [Ammoniphilus sp. CFH 90114]
MMRRNCRDCDITLTNYEKEELKDQCLDCYREVNDIKKLNRTNVVRMKNKKFLSVSAR